MVRNRTGKITPLTLSLEAKIKPHEFSRFGGMYTIVVKLTPTEVCVVGRVPSGPYEAEALASLRGWPPRKKCIPLKNTGEKDWLGVVFGLSQRGRFEEAKAALKKIASPATRTVAYLDIARSEAESGNQQSARSTLFAALNAWLKQKDLTIFYNAYGVQVQEQRIVT